MIFFAARLSSLDTYEVITIDNFEQNHKKYNCYERTKKTPLPQKFSHLQFGDRLDEYIGLVSYRVNCHLNIVVPKKTPKNLFGTILNKNNDKNRKRIKNIKTRALSKATQKKLYLFLEKKTRLVLHSGVKKPALFCLFIIHF